MAYFPLFIDIRGKTCLVIGGGKVAERKVTSLLRYGALVRVISPEISPRIRSLLEDQPDSLCFIAPKEDLLEKEISRAALVVAASGSRELNHQTAEICHRKRVPVNVVDAPKECSFLFPALVKKGDISIGINTAGQSPVVSSVIREEIEDLLPDYYGQIAAQQSHLRALIRDRLPDEKDRRSFLKKAAQKAFEAGRPLSEREIQVLIHEQ